MEIVPMITSLMGAIIGTAGFTLSSVNFRRDQPRIRVALNWNMVNPTTSAAFGMISATNTGRRPIFIGGAALEIKGDPVHLLLDDSLAGTRLGEGEKPAKYLIDLDRMKQHSDGWRKIRAYVEDSTGQRYYSSYPSRRAHPPKWALKEKAAD